MNRQSRKFFALHERLDKAIDKRIELGFRQRPFLEDKSLPAVILERTDADIEEKIDNDAEIELLVKELRILCQ